MVARAQSTLSLARSLKREVLRIRQPARAHASLIELEM
jgi:hypothetical protein